ncbi:MAG: hypothetical protein JNL67_04265 [Planctomycetaceae bacterium]|nr:hypothetical protein [Planctomycetaceae bacterium]
MNSIPVLETASCKRHAKAWRPWPFHERPWRRAIRESGLSSEIQALLFQVVGSTGLLADEKLEVAEELIAHFEDGLQRGRSVATLIEGFGDLQVAAQLIGNGKQRTRGMKNRLVQGSLWLGGLSAGGFLALVVIFYMGKPQPSVDYLAQVNKPALEAADHEKGWTVYRDLWTKHGFSEGGGFKSTELYLMEEDGTYGRMVRPTDGPAWEAATRRLSEIEDLLEGFRVGGLRPSFGVPLHVDLSQYSEADFRALFPNRDFEAAKAASPSDQQFLASSLLNVLLPHVQVMREAARLLIADTRWALEQGDTERATRNVEAMLGISSQVTESKFLVCSLVGYAIHSITMGVIDECLDAEVEFSDSQLRRIEAAIVKADLEKMVDIASERAMFMDIVQKSYTDDGQGDGRITATGLELWEQMAINNAMNSEPEQGLDFQYVAKRTLAPTSILFMASRKQLTEKAEELFSRMAAVLKDEDGPAATRKIEQEIKDLPIGYTPIKMLFPAIAAARQATVRVKVNAESVLTAIAVIRYERENGRLPESLDQLVGPYLKSLAMDPLDGKALRYLRKDDGFIIYSVGVNGVDDGGQPVLIRPDGSFVEDPSKEENTESLRHLPAGAYIVQRNYPGDWILWPRLSGQDD